MEVEDLRAAYLEAEGDLDGIFERVPCCGVDDEVSHTNGKLFSLSVTHSLQERFRAILDPFIASEELPSFKAPMSPLYDDPDITQRGSHSKYGCRIS